VAITTDNQTRRLYSYVQLQGHEIGQVREPADPTELRYFVVGTAVYDLHEFSSYEGLWETDADKRVAVQRLSGIDVLVGVIDHG
jgi:hypothetical protein